MTGNGFAESARRGDVQHTKKRSLTTAGRPIMECDTLCSARCCVCFGRRSAKLKLCSGCRRVLYCSAHCQKSDWPAHKRACIQAQDRIRRDPDAAEITMWLERRCRKLLREKYLMLPLRHGDGVLVLCSVNPQGAIEEWQMTVRDMKTLPGEALRVRTVSPLTPAEVKLSRKPNAVLQTFLVTFLLVDITYKAGAPWHERCAITENGRLANELARASFSIKLLNTYIEKRRGA